LSHDRRLALRNARGKVVQRLFAHEYEAHPVDDPHIRELLRWEGGDEVAREYADRLYAGVLAHYEALDARIREFSRGWSLERLARIDRNILRVALCEILFDPEIPFRVSVHEALELAHQFSDPEAVSFINGILHEAAVSLVPEKGPYEENPASKKPSRILGKALERHGGPRS